MLPHRLAPLALLVASCAAPASRPGTVARAVPTLQGERGGGNTRQSGPVRFQLADEASLLPQLEIEQPREGEEISKDRASSQPIVVRDGGFLRRRPSGRLAFVLDGDLVRDVGVDEKPALGALMPEDRDLTPGEHVLAVVACDADGKALRDARGKARVAVRRFWVGPRGPARGDESAAMLVVLHPRGTFNGALAAGSAALDVVVHGAELERGKIWVDVVVTGSGPRSAAVLTREGQFWVSGLTSGDHRLDVSLRGTAPGRGARVTRDITVNIDAPGAPGEAPR